MRLPVRPLVALFAVLVLLGPPLSACGSSDAGGGANSCVGQTVTAEVTRDDDGAKALRVRGRYFVAGCADTGGPQPPPMHDIAILAGQVDQQPRRLTTVDAAGTLGVFDVVVALPRTLRSGTLDVSAADSAPVRVAL